MIPGSLTRTPVHWMIQKMKKAKAILYRDLGRAPSAAEVASFLDVSVEKLELYAESSRNVLSLEQPLRDGDARTLGELISSGSPTPNDHAEYDSLRSTILEVINELDDRERDVLVVRYGLEDRMPRSTQETATMLGLSRDRVRVIEARALNKLRNPQRNYKLKEYAGVPTEEREEELRNSPERMWAI